MHILNILKEGSWFLWMDTYFPNFHHQEHLHAPRLIKRLTNCRVFLGCFYDSCISRGFFSENNEIRCNISFTGWTQFVRQEFYGVFVCPISPAAACTSSI